MPTPDALEGKFWKALKSDMTMMLGLAGVAEGHTRPMTAQLAGDADRGPIWFFTSADSELVTTLRSDAAPAVATFVSKGHDVFAAVHGDLRVETDRAMVERLWNRFVAAWYQGGKDDPTLRLLRLDAREAQIWLDGSSLLAGVKMMVGVDPQQDYRSNVAKVALD